MPLALRSGAFVMKSGKCLAEQVGVNAPGRPKRTTFYPEKSTSLLIVSDPSAPTVTNMPEGIVSPKLTVIILDILISKSLPGTHGRTKNQCFHNSI